VTEPTTPFSTWASAEIQRLEARKAELETENERLQQERNEAKVDLMVAQTQMKELLKQLDAADALRKQAEEIREHVERAAKAEINSLRARKAELEDALTELVAAFVNPSDGGEFEAGEVPALDKARAALTKVVCP
jgi:DNA repair exonuclease SbcCD ATPase subunit